MHHTIAVITGNGELAEQHKKMFEQIPGICFYNEPEMIIDEPGAVIDMTFDGSPERIDVLKRFLPRPVAVNSVLFTVAEINAPFIRFNGWPGMLNHKTAEVFFLPEQENSAQELFETLGWKWVLLPDLCGFAGARVVSMIINEAWFAYEEGVSSKPEIDTAMKLGTNYPYGPFEWAAKIGTRNIYMLLEKLSQTDKRYLPATLLEKEAKEKNH